ncbi:unnamed protein product [Fraxinus pennsylvanica]|uniref:Fructose-bisphosphate aldolase n=1 Tax=Fraxinus pennsylvanica TaxID=56036 RepID=A0AAD2DSC9_9LAMI|nr:unnamed protein product [Fraxinus pennsylvanica]
MGAVGGAMVKVAVVGAESLVSSPNSDDCIVDLLDLVLLPGSNDESWCQGLDGLASRSVEYYKQGVRFAKWRTVVSIPCGPSALAVKAAAWVSLVMLLFLSSLNPGHEILLDGDHPIKRTIEMAEHVWSEVFYWADNNVVFEGILLKPSMVTPGAEHEEKASPETIAKYTLTMLKKRVPPAVPGIMI